MPEREVGAPAPPPPRLLIVDDEEQFRLALKRQLEVRGYEVLEVDNGPEAIGLVRRQGPEVVVLDHKMPGMDGLETLAELKKVRPEVQVIMLTGHGTTELARQAGKLDVFEFIEKPCALEALIETIEAARKERKAVLAQQEIPDLQGRNLQAWLVGVHYRRPGVVIVGVALFLLISFLPAPPGLLRVLTARKGSAGAEVLRGYAGYSRMEAGRTIARQYSAEAGLDRELRTAAGGTELVPLSTLDAAFRAQVMIGALVIAGLFWATGAIPIGMTALLVAAIMYFFGVFPAGRVAGAFARDPVVFIFGVLALAAAAGKTGLDRRLGLWLLARSGGAGGFLLVFCPLLALAASFISGFALVVVMTPVLVTGYRAAARAQGLKADRGLAAMILLGLAFAANLGGPGSPAATGRNAIMLGMLSDYGVNLSFGQWARLGLPVAPALAFAAGLYLFLVFRRRLQVKSPDLAAEARREREILGPMAGKEYFTAAVLLLLLAAWLFGGGAFGLGGPVLAALLALNLGGVLRWKDVAGIHWDMVALYAAAGALSLGLAATGAAPWLADSLFRRLPDFFQAGDGLALGAGLMGGVAANLLGDGVAVAMLGPFTAPMAGLAGASAVKVGLAYAFATSFAHLTVVATPVNAIVFSLARDPETGDQLVTMRDFFVHGAAVLAIDFAVLWLFAICGYWHWLGT